MKPPARALALLATALVLASRPPAYAATTAPAATEPAGATEADRTAEAAFPDDGVLLVVSLQKFDRVRFGAVSGCDIRLSVDRVLRLTPGKDAIVSKANPLTLKDTLQLLGGNNGNRVLLYKRWRTQGEAGAADEDKRLEKLLKKDQPYLLVLPSVMQLSPVPAVFPNAPWAQLGEEPGLIIVDFSAAAAPELPGRVKAVRGWIGELSAAGKRRSDALEGLTRNRDLAEPMLLRELARTKGPAQMAAALALAELGNPGATDVLAAAVGGDDPVVARDAIAALRKIKGWRASAAAALIAKLDDDRPHGEGDAAFVLSDDAARTLEATTGQHYGKNKAIWTKWLEKASRPSNDQPPGGGFPG